MQTIINGPLDELSDQELYRIIGDAWIAQLNFQPGESFYLGSAEEMGKQEFTTLMPSLRNACGTLNPIGNQLNMTANIKRNATWAVPISVVSVLAKRQMI
jgi:hypothetical protein